MEANEAAYLEDLKKFRWELYHNRRSNDIVKCLCRFYFKKYYFQHFAEEIVIAGYDLKALNHEIRSEIQHCIPSLSVEEFPSILEKDDRVWDINRIFICLAYKNFTCAVKGFELIREKRPSELCKEFVNLGWILWQLEAWLDPSVSDTALWAKYQFLNPTQIELVDQYAVNFKHWIGIKYKNVVEIIEAVLPVRKFRYKKMAEHFDRPMCLDVLIDWGDVTTMFHNNKSALYYSVKFKNASSTHKLLDRGSFFGTVTDPNDINICNIDSRMLKNHLDDCITKCVDDDRFVEIDFKNLISPPNSCSRCDGSCSNEMKAIELLSTSREHKHLLTHPVLSMFALLKWNRIAYLLYIDFIIYALFTLSTIGFILQSEEAQGVMKNILAVSTSILTLYVSMRRILDVTFDRLYLEPRHHIFKLLRCTQTFLIVTTVLLLLLNVFKNYRPFLATFCILMIASELFVLSGSLLWSFSQHYRMFLDVAISSLKSLQLCLVLLPAFSLSFYILLRSPSPGDKNENNTGDAEENPFNHIRSLITTVVALSIGEVNSGDFDSSAVGACFFVAFVFLISTSFMNLMNGLAVNDIRQIQSHAEETSLIQRVRVLQYYEGIKSFKLHWIRKKLRYTLVTNIFKYFAKDETFDILSHPFNTKIYIGPDHRVLILRRDYKTSEQSSINFDQNGTYVNSWISYFKVATHFLRVDRDVMHHIHKILDKKINNIRKECEKNQLKKRISKLEGTLEQIMYKLSQK